MPDDAMTDLRKLADALSNPQRRLLEEIYEAFVETSKWPTYQVIDHRADAKGVDDPLAAMQSLSSRLLIGVNEGTAPGLEQELGLTIEGVAVVASWNPVAKSDLNLFVRSVVHAVTVSDRTPPPASAVFDALGFLTSIYPQGPEVALLDRLYGIWKTAGGLWRSLSANADLRWTAVLNQQALRRYRGVHDVAGLIAVEATQHGAQTAPPTNANSGIRPAGQAVGPRMPVEDAQMPTWAALLPDKFRTAIGSRLRESEPDAILAAWIELADLIHRKTGLEHDAATLINQAFGKDTTYYLAAQDTESGRNLHAGYVDLMRGLARMRNVHAHRGRPKVVSELHVAALVLTMGDCYENLARLPDLA